MSISEKTKKLPLIIFLFIVIEIFIYILYMYIDILLSSGSSQSVFLLDAYKKGLLDSSMIKYYSIILCLAISIFIYYKNKGKAKSYPSLAAAMLFTAVSDYFLLLNPGYIQYGLLSFCAVHIIYLYIINNGDIKKTAITTLIRIGVAITVAFVILKLNIIKLPNDSHMSAIIILVLLYGISFVSNVIRHLTNIISVSKGESKDSRTCLFEHPRLFLLGLFLFILCDLNVLIYNLGNFITISSSFYKNIQPVSAVLMWTFYLPSQVLIVSSCIFPIKTET